MNLRDELLKTCNWALFNNEPTFYYLGLGRTAYVFQTKNMDRDASAPTAIPSLLKGPNRWALVEKAWTAQQLVLLAESQDPRVLLAAIKLQGLL